MTEVLPPAILLPEKVELLKLLHQKACARARDDFYTFVRLCAPLVLPSEYLDGKHIHLICEKLQKLESGEIENLAIMLAPGSMKSLLASTLYPAWCLGRHASWYVMEISHSAELAHGFGRKVRDLLEEPLLQEIFPSLQLRPDSRAAGRWNTTGKGAYLAAGAGANIAGFRFNLGILDDPLSEQTALSDAERAKINAWYGPGFKTRGLPSARKLCVMTRWHMDDLLGFILHQSEHNSSADKWEVVRIPALLDQESADLLGLPPFTSYWPEMWPTEKLKRTMLDKETMPPSKWNALYMQSPIPEEGALFKKTHFREWPFDDPPKCNYVLMSLDTAFSTRTTADFSVIQVWGIFNRTEANYEGVETEVAHMILLANRRGRWEFKELYDEALKAFKEWKADRIIIEKKASGQSLLQELRRVGLPVQEYTPDKDKLSRAHAATPLMEGGRVWVPKLKFADDLMEEAWQFPYGKHDDQVDSCVQAVLFMREGWNITNPDDPEWKEAEGPRKKKGYWH